MDDRTQTHASERVVSLIARCLAGDAVDACREIEGDNLWEYVVTHACLSEVGGVLICRLREQNVEVPAWSAAQLDAYREHLAAADAYSRSRAETILAELAASGVPFLLLKGAALNTVLYDEPGLRAMVDIDVLIRPADAARADEVLRRTGCMPGADLVNDDFYPRYYYEREYFTPHSPPVKIDLHVRPFRPLRYARTVPDDALWDEPAPVKYGQLTVAIPSPENMLIHLATHAACHGLVELKWLYDIHLWLDRFGGQIDPAALADKCRRWKLTWPVRRALEKIAESFRRPTPSLVGAFDAVSEPVGVLDKLALAHCPQDNDHPASALLVNMLCTPGVRFRLGFLRSVLIPGTGHLAQLYRGRHPGWTLIAHLVRIVRGLARPLVPGAPEPVG